MSRQACEDFLFFISKANDILVALDAKDNEMCMRVKVKHDRAVAPSSAVDAFDRS